MHLPPNFFLRGWSGAFCQLIWHDFSNSSIRKRGSSKNSDFIRAHVGCDIHLHCQLLRKVPIKDSRQESSPETSWDGLLRGFFKVVISIFHQTGLSCENWDPSLISRHLIDPQNIRYAVWYSPNNRPCIKEWHYSQWVNGCCLSDWRISYVFPLHYFEYHT